MNLSRVTAIACAGSLLVAGVAVAQPSVPASPCADLEGTRRALQEAARAEGNELDVAVAQVEQNLGARLLRETTNLTPDRRAALVDARARAWCEMEGRFPSTAAAASLPSAERLKAILDRPEFEGARERHKDTMASLLARISEWLKSLLDTDSARSFGAFSEVVRVLVLTLAVALVILAGIRVAQARRARGLRGQSVTAASGPLVLEDPASHLGKARAALSADPRHAIREGLLALLSMLERKRWARPDRVKTNRELAAELPKRGAPGDVSEQVEAWVRWYDRTFYSLAPVPREEAERFVDEVARFEGRIAGGSA